jgi:hypothetical protein
MSDNKLIEGIDGVSLESESEKGGVQVIFIYLPAIMSEINCRDSTT